MSTEKLDSLKLAQFCVCGISILRELERSNSTITYGDLAKHLGIWPKGLPWHVKYRTAITDVLNSIAALADKCGEPSLCHRVRRERDGKSGPGSNRHCEIVVQ